MKSIRLVPCIGLAAAVLMPAIGSLHASIITINSFDVSNTSASSFAVTPSAAGNPTTYSFTRTGNLDGGTINDTLSFDFVYTMYTGSTFDGTNVTLGTSVALADFSNPHFMNNYVGDANTDAVAAGDSFTASITNISYTSGEGFTSPPVSFDGFNSIAKFGDGDADVFIGTSSAVTKTVGTANGPITLDGVTDLTMTASAASNQRWRDLNFSFTVPEATAVPEASSIGVFGLGVVGLCMARRRKRAGG